jgi:uncharacterized protein YoxC
MSQTTEILFAVFAGLTALALLLQGVALIALARRIQEIKAGIDARSDKLTKQVDSIVSHVEGLVAVLKSTAQKAHEIEGNVAAITAVVRGRVVDLDAFLNEATDAARLQMARLQDIIETTSNRIDETIDTLQNSIIVPITEISAVIRGIRSGFDVLFGRRKLSSHRSHNDEEMFI